MQSLNGSRRILIVNSDPVMSLAQELALCGHHAHLGVGREDARRIAERERPDLVMIEIVLRGPDN